MRGLQVEQIILLLIFVIVPLWRVVKNWVRQKTEQLAQQNAEVAAAAGKTRPVEPLDPFSWPPATQAWDSETTTPVTPVVVPLPVASKLKSAAVERTRRKAVALPVALVSSPSIGRDGVRFVLADAQRLKQAFALSVVLGPPRALDPAESQDG